MKPSCETASIKTDSPLWYDKLYWLVPAVLTVLQLVYIAASTTHIREEELAESIRNVFWLEHRLLYDGVSSNVGYYGLLLIVYKFFGFSIHAAKYVRLILYAAAIYSLAVLLQKFMQRIYATAILLTIGLSPTILFFNTIQTSYGIDILYGIICLLIALQLHFDGSPKDLSLAFLLGSIAMLAALSYPAFLLYLPSLAFVYVYLWWPKRNEQKARKRLAIGVISSAVGFLVPFLIALFYLNDAREFLNDPATQAGVFRGPGKLQMDMQTLKDSLRQTLADVFQEGTSYYFYLQRPDFSGPLTWIAVMVAFALGVLIAVKTPPFRPVLLLAGFHILVNLIIPSLADDPGLRRSTGFLAGIYAWHTIVLHGLFTRPALRKIKWIGVATCLVLAGNNLMSYPSNIRAVSSPIAFISNDTWFAVEDTPEKSLAYWLDATARGETLTCYDASNARVACQYAKIYAAIAGFRHWNGLSEVPVKAYDWKTQQTRILSPELWESYYFPHDS